MKKVISLFIFLFASISVHAAYEIRTEVQISNNQPQWGKVIVNEGEKATLKFDDLTIQLVPKSYATNAVDLQTRIIENNSGKEKVVSRPRIITQLGKSAEITQQNDEGDYFRLKVIILNIKSNT